MATLSVQTIDPNGGLAQINFSAAAAGGDEYANDGETVLLIKNDDASGHTATFADQKTYRGYTVEDPTVTVANGDIGAGPALDPSIFNDSNGRVQVTYDGVTSLSVAAVRIG